jgi:hypothetical protein
MRTLAQLILVFLVVTTLSGCIAGKQEYQSYLAAQQARDQQQAVEEQKRSERWQEMAKACNGDPTCIREVAREATLSDAFASVAASGGGGRSQIQQFQVQAHPATAALTSLGGIAIQQGIQGAVQIRQSDNARDVSINANTMQAQTQQAAIGLGIAAVNSSAGAVTSVANILPGLAPTQTYTSGGPMSLGDMNIGDQVGRDNVRDGSQVGHSGPINTGTQNTNGVIGAGQIGSGRQNSAGPYRLTDVANVGPRCDGENCQRVPLPEPKPKD